MIKIFLLFFFTYMLVVQPVYASAKNIAYVYKDEGVSHESLTQTISTFTKLLGNQYLVKTINAKEVKQGIWRKYAALLIMPGGADLPYVKNLNGLGNQKIKQYVEEGGSYLGICAGAYYASSYVEFDKHGSLEVLGNRELKFFPGKAIGPILAPYDYKTQSGSRAAEMTTVFNQVPKTAVYYNGGGFFENAEKFPNTDVLATYQNKLPAIVVIRYGKGIVLLSGVHFEYDPSLLDFENVYIQKIMTQLTQGNNTRKILINQLLKILGISVKNDIENIYMH